MQRFDIWQASQEAGNNVLAHDVPFQATSAHGWGTGDLSRHAQQVVSYSIVISEEPAKGSTLKRVAVQGPHGRNKHGAEVSNKAVRTDSARLTRSTTPGEADQQPAPADYWQRWVAQPPQKLGRQLYAQKATWHEEMALLSRKLVVTQAAA